MLSEAVRIDAINGELVHLVGSRRSTCSKCTLRGGCGQYVFGAGQDQKVILHRNDLGLADAPLAAGATLLLGLQEGGMTKLALLFYCMPLGLLLIAALAASLLGASEALVAGAGLSGLVGGLLLLPRLQSALTRQVTCSLAPPREKVRITLPESDDEN